MTESEERHMKIRRSHRAAGFTLIELMIVVAIIGILAVLAIYGVSRYLKTSKTAEATNNVGAIAKNASESLNRDLMSGAYVAPGTATGISHCICAGATASVPSTIASVTAKKYTSDPVADWKTTATGQDTIGWHCLKFTVDQPQYYMYNYTESGNSCTSGTVAADDIHAVANGDLDGNGTQSTFDLEGKVAAGETQPTWAPKALETLPEE
jgi:type IV pilus assembly protein PilA